MIRFQRWGCVALLLWSMSSAAAAGEVLVGAAISLREPMEDLIDRFERIHPEIRVRLVLGASSNLARQIESGAPLALFASADERSIRRLISRSLVKESDHIRIAANALVIVARPGASFRVDAFRDLMSSRVERIALPAAAVPLGGYAREWLSSHGWVEGLDDRIVVTEHAVATLGAVEQSHVDVAIVYETDARLAKDVEVVYRIPSQEHPEIIYSLALVRGSGEVEGASRFYQYLSGPEAASVLVGAGFRVPASSNKPPSLDSDSRSP